MSNKSMNLIIEGLDKIDESNISIKNMKKDIEKTKNKLKKSKMKENFGEDGVRKIKDKYAGLMTDYYAEYSSLISNFEDWCANYEGTNEETQVDEDRWVTMKNNHVLVDNKGNAKSDLMKKMDKDKGSEPDVKSSKKELEKAKKSGDKNREKVAQKKLDRAEKEEAKKEKESAAIKALKKELEKAKKSGDKKRIVVAQKNLDRAMSAKANQRKIIEAFDREGRDE